MNNNQKRVGHETLYIASGGMHKNMIEYWTKNRCTAQCAGLYFHEMEVMPMNEKRKNEKKAFDFKDLMAFGMFILALLTFIYMICH